MAGPRITEVSLFLAGSSRYTDASRISVLLFLLAAQMDSRSPVPERRGEDYAVFKVQETPLCLWHGDAFIYKETYFSLNLESMRKIYSGSEFLRSRLCLQCKFGNVKRNMYQNILPQVFIQLSVYPAILINQRAIQLQYLFQRIVAACHCSLQCLPEFFASQALSPPFPSAARSFFSA